MILASTTAPCPPPKSASSTPSPPVRLGIGRWMKHRGLMIARPIRSLILQEMVTAETPVRTPQAQPAEQSESTAKPVILTAQTIIFQLPITQILILQQILQFLPGSTGPGTLHFLKFHY